MPLHITPKRARHADFDDVPAALQRDVAANVARSIGTWLPQDASANARRLVSLIGDPAFYDVVATIDPKRASDWREMAKVQRGFAAAEPTFDEKTRAYSESMRLTLHAALIQHLVDGTRVGDAKDLFETFLELHATAFDENGAWFDNMQIGWKGALDVVKSTPVEMAYHLEDLVEGSFASDPDTMRAAQWVRDARAAVLNGARATPGVSGSSAPPRDRP